MAKSELKGVTFLRTEDLELDSIIPDAEQLARHTDKEKIRLFGLDMLANGQLHAVSTTEDRRLIAGHQRLLGARSAGMKTLKANIYPASLTETQFRLIRAAENFHRTDLNAHQKWIVGTELMCANPTWKLQDLAEHLHLDPSSITRLMSPSKCIPAWQEALRDGNVGISDVYVASKLPEADQAGLLALKQSGISRDKLEAAGKKVRNAVNSTETVKTSSIRIAIGEVVITVKGADLTLGVVAELLDKASKEAEKAKTQGLNAKTAERVWKDRAVKSKATS